MRYRSPTKYEQKILHKLLAAKFDGVEALRLQLSGIQVRSIASYPKGDPSLELKVSSNERAIVNKRVPVWLAAHDEDGAPIEILLHIVDGVLNELEFVTYGDSLPNPLPAIESFEIRTQ